VEVPDCEGSTVAEKLQAVLSVNYFYKPLFSSLLYLGLALFLRSQDVLKNKVLFFLTLYIFSQQITTYFIKFLESLRTDCRILDVNCVYKLVITVKITPI